MSSLLLKVVTPQGEVFDGEVLSITLPGEEGEMGVLPAHASLLSNLKPGIIRIEKQDQSVESIVISWGVAKIDEQHVTILIDEAVALSGTSSSIIDAVSKAKELIQKALPNNAMMVGLEKQIETSAKELF